MRTLGQIVIAISVLAASPVAQQKPSFSGHWVITSPEKNAGAEQIVTQDAKTLTVEQKAKDATRKMSFPLDGVERRMAAPRSDFVVMAKASWEGNTIVVITNTSYPGGMKTQAKDVWSIDAQGRLIIDSTETGNAGAPEVLKLIHVKKK